MDFECGPVVADRRGRGPWLIYRRAKKVAVRQGGGFSSSDRRKITFPRAVKVSKIT